MILQIYRDSVKAGGEAAFRAMEENAALVCAELGCPHPHLAIESLSGSHEVWWLNAYDSEDQKQRVAADYASNQPLLAALTRAVEGKQEVTGTPVDVFADHRPDLSRGAAWNVAGARFFVVTVTRGESSLDGSVFESPDGRRFILRPVRTRQEADLRAAAAGPETRVFAVRPYWGMPAKEWIDADPEFWKPNPMASRHTSV
jgi:hypothetical protein